HEHRGRLPPSRPRARDDRRDVRAKPSPKWELGQRRQETAAINAGPREKWWLTEPGIRKSALGALMTAGGRLAGIPVEL
ncbi:MAG TPA: hypothetical protein VNA69_22045, partial [Thermoanaerobaculia bacterium]|nr:hypothetical protein [Thermoanaerobaculia bacterium]